MNEELWSLDDTKKSEDEIYFEELSAEGMKVPELIKRLKKDGKITDETIIQVGAQTNWLWIDKFKYFDRFKLFAEKEFHKAKTETEKLEKQVQALIRDIPTFNKQYVHSVAYIAEFSNKMIATGQRLQDAEMQLRKAVRSVKWGQYDNRKVLEVYRSIQNQDAVMIHIVGDESGKYWDYEEVLAERNGKS